MFKPDGTLVRTLWSKVRYLAGTNTAVWDGLDDNSNVMAAGTYQIRVLQHNTEYVWEGPIGNTSSAMSGPTVHTGFYPMRDMAISGTNAFYVSGYNENNYDFRSFTTTNPQQVKSAWYWVYSAQFNRVSSFPGDVNDLNWLWTAADSNRVYFACSATPNPTNTAVPGTYPGCIVSCNVTDNSQAYFSSGVQIVNAGALTPLPNGIYVGTRPGLSGLSVQLNGNLLAAAVGPDNRVYLMDKVAGTALGSFSVPSPGRLNFSPDGALWVISGTSVLCYTNLNSTPALVATIPNLAEPLDVAVNPTNANLILVADGGSSQQVKAFDRTGAPVWTYGLAGGYPVNGAAVTTNKFWFFDGEKDGTFICYAPDGSFWVGDGGNHRAMHFSAGLNYLEQIMHQPHSYIASVDQNNPSRVFNEFLEFNVDYTQPLPQAWTLVNNWQAGVPAVNISWNDGIQEVTTFTNGHTYALVDNNASGHALRELCELGTNFLRLTGIYPMITNQGRWMSLGPDGSARATAIGAASWYESTLSGFDASNNPIWRPVTTLATASQAGTDPVPRCCSLGYVRATISTNNIEISFDQSLNYGWHLGGVRLGATNWLWKASPAVQWMNGCGTYEIDNGVQYAGNSEQAVDRNVMYGYHGEFFRNEGQASQTMHFYDDGLFVGQFGIASPGHSPYDFPLPGFAGNGGSPTLVKTSTGDYYMWINDEAEHGPQCWHFVNARNIREQSGTGLLGSTITLTNPPCGFPVNVTGKSGNQSGELTWQAVPGAASYNIYYSVQNGGPYLTLAGTTTNVDFVVGGLTNNQPYYFAVTAIQGGVEGMPSEQVEIHPFDTTQYVLCAGSYSDGGQFNPYIEVSSTNVSQGQPGFVCQEQMTALLNLRELCYYGFGNFWNQSVGCMGYILYSYGGLGVHLINITPPLTTIPGSGWSDIQYLQRIYRADGVLGSSHGVIAGPVASIAIQPGDANYHYLTVVSPAQFNNPAIFQMRLTSTNGTSAAFNVNETPGRSHMFQFLYKGNVTLWADGTGGSGAIVQSLFFDNAPVTYAKVLAPPTRFRLVSP